ncbi:MAG: hypothetical protein ACI4GY_02025 [Acutalibacteraceae bacterium]
MKKLISFLTVILMLGSLCSCIQNEEPTTASKEETSVQTTAEAQPDSSAAAKETAQAVVQNSVQTTNEKTQASTTQEETEVQTTSEATTAVKKQKPKISASELFDANTLSMLLNNYSCVRVERTFDYGKQTEQYSLLDGEMLQIVKNSPKDSDPYYYGRFGSFYFEVESDRTKAYIMLDDLNRETDFPSENTIAALFSDCKASFVKETEDCYIYKVTYPDMGVDDMEITVTVKKDTLAVVKAVYKSDGEVTQTDKYTLDEQAKDYAKIISNFKEKKTVTVIAEKSKGSNKTVKETKLKLPSDWEIFINDSDELVTYMDSGYTVPYQYPGNGKNYKIYVTNSMG